MTVFVDYEWLIFVVFLIFIRKRLFDQKSYWFIDAIGRRLFRNGSEFRSNPTHRVSKEKNKDVGQKGILDLYGTRD